MLAMVRRVLLVMALLSLVIKTPSHASDDAAESCWRRRCWGDMAMTQCRCRVMLVTMLSSHAADNTAGVT
jgi:hypothetical protein